MNLHLLRYVVSAASLTAVATAQGPDIIHYTFDNGDATNSATGPVPDGIAGAGVTFGPSVCGGGAIAQTLGATCQIDTGWTTDLGTGSWSVGMWLDRTSSPIALNTVQYILGNSTAGGMRCFVGGIAGTGGIVLRAPFNAATIPGGGALRPVHVVWCYDSAAGSVYGYLDDTLVVTTPNAGVNIVGTGNMTIMRNDISAASMGAGYEMDDFRFYRRCLSQPEIAAWFASCAGGSIGNAYCGPAVANSTGNSAFMSASGSATVANNDLVLEANDLPTNSFGFFLTSMAQGNVPLAGGSQGVLCLGGSIGRYVGAGQIQNSGALGSFSLGVDLTQHPTPTGLVSVAAGETWHFQSWYRDAVGGNATSNFTDGYSILFN